MNLQQARPLLQGVRKPRLRKIVAKVGRDRWARRVLVVVAARPAVAPYPIPDDREKPLQYWLDKLASGA